MRPAPLTRLITRSRTAVIVVLLCLPAFGPVGAQEAPEGEDPPDRVARLSYRLGDVVLEEAGGGSATATLNRPLTTGDRLWADRGSRAELQVGSATMHIDESTAIEVRDLRSDSLAIGLDEGVLGVHVRDVGRTEVYEVETPNAVVVLTRPGEYSIEVNRSGDTTVVRVREGSASVDSGQPGTRTYHVDAGRQGIFTGEDRLSAAIDAVDRRSAFESWSREREERAARSPASRYVSREVIGYEDLDDHGDWHTHAEYGVVWYPRTVASAWAPYRYGHWVWVRPWGWTWVDDAPWGFAPFHYGRWAHIGSRWGWIPGPRHVRPVYAPALVAWVGGPSVSVSVTLGSGIGWFPLGPREVYVPGYRASRRHVTNVNVSNTLIINRTHIDTVYATRGRGERYVHQGRRDAVTLVSGEDFRRGRPVDRHQLRWTERDQVSLVDNTLTPDRGREDSGFDGQRGRHNLPRPSTSSREERAASAERRGASPEVSPVDRRSTRDRDTGRGPEARGEADPADSRGRSLSQPDWSTERRGASRPAEDSSRWRDPPSPRAGSGRGSAGSDDWQSGRGLGTSRSGSGRDEGRGREPQSRGRTDDQPVQREAPARSLPAPQAGKQIDRDMRSSGGGQSERRGRQMPQQEGEGGRR